MSAESFFFLFCFKTDLSPRDASFSLFLLGHVLRGWEIFGLSGLDQGNHMNIGNLSEAGTAISSSTARILFFLRTDRRGQRFGGP